MVKHKQFMGRQIVLVCLTILLDWCLKGEAFFSFVLQISCFSRSVSVICGVGFENYLRSSLFLVLVKV